MLLWMHNFSSAASWLTSNCSSLSSLPYFYLLVLLERLRMFNYIIFKWIFSLYSILRVALVLLVCWFLLLNLFSSKLFCFLSSYSPNSLIGWTKWSWSLLFWFVSSKASFRSFHTQNLSILGIKTAFLLYKSRFCISSTRMIFDSINSNLTNRMYEWLYKLNYQIL